MPAWLTRGLGPLLARLFLACIFIQGAFGKIAGWDGQAGYMARHGMHFIQPLLGAALAIEALGSLCLLLGFKARPAAAVMCLYLLAVSVLLHDFWSAADPNVAGQMQTHFFKNLAIAGGLLMVACAGPGRWALDGLAGKPLRP